MSLLQEESGASRELRVHRSKAPPLPRLSKRPITGPDADGTPTSEVLVIGAGPAGLFLTLCLARLGLAGSSLACIDAKSTVLKAGQADGLQPRTLEVLRSLGLLNEIIDEGCHMVEVTFWNPTPNGQGIRRTTRVPDVAVRARYQHEITIHQGRIERILEEDLKRYTSNGITRNTTFLDYTIQSDDLDFPVHVSAEEKLPDGTIKQKTMRCKYLVGADGAHSRVRQSMGLKLEGESLDHVWGVCDFVADTDFPDIRKRSVIHSSAGSLMVIPREKIHTGEYLTRLYVQIKDAVDPSSKDEDQNNDEFRKQQTKERRKAVTLDYIFTQANRILSPYSIRVKAGSEPDWFAAYQIGQRVAPRFSKEDDQGMERVFIVGDACHTHSPKAGQGMNVSMMDSYNLSWKLIHTINGLVPEHAGDTQKSDTAILASYATERMAIARQLIDFDTKFSSMFSGAIGSEHKTDSGEKLTHEQFLRVFSEGNGFTSGCGIEYPPNVLVDSQCSQRPDYPVAEDCDYLNGCLKPGRRFADAVVKRFADATLRHLQDDFPSTGRYRLLMFTPNDVKRLQPQVAGPLQTICDLIIPKYPAGVVEIVALHLFNNEDFEWTDIHPYFRSAIEMTFYASSLSEHVYDVYGVDASQGALVVVRPDGYIGVVTVFSDTATIDSYLGRCLRLIAEGVQSAGASQ